MSSAVPRLGGSLTDFVPASYPLDPHKTGALGQQIPGAAMSRVFRYRAGPDPQIVADRIVVPDLGSNAESPDAMTWTIKLRPDARFQNIGPVNGHPVEAEDVKATFTRALEPETGNPNRSALEMINTNQIEAPDEQTVVFKLNYPYAPFRDLLASPAYSWILPREVLSGGLDPAKTVIGSGPFELESAQPDTAYTFKRNPNWFDAPRPYIDRLRVAVIADSAQRLAQFAAGNLDHLELNSPFDLPPAKQSAPKAAVLKTAWGRAVTLYFQLGYPSSAFQDIRVRRALSMAIDRDALGKAVYGGEAVQTVFVPAYMGRWSLPVDRLVPSVRQYYSYNPGEASKLLSAAGQSTLAIRLASTAVSQGNLDVVKLQEGVNSMLKLVGVRSSIVNLDFNKDYIAGGKGVKAGYYDKDLVPFLGSASLTDADEFLFGYFHSRSTGNIERLSDSSLDAMIEKQRTLVNEDERVAAVLDIQRYVADRMYAPSTVGSYRWQLVQPRVRNYNYSDTVGLYTENYAGAWLS